LRLRLPLIAALAVSAALPAAAPAAVTIGSNLAGTGADNLGAYCPSGGVCTGTNLSLPPGSTAANGLVSPINGVVVRWRVKSGSSGNPVTLRVLRPAGGATFTGAGTSTPAATASGISGFFPTRLPIRAGDSVGLNIANSALVWANTAGANGLVWGSLNGYPAGLADGGTAAGAAQGNKELLVQAVVEPDVDGDGFGDETQDGCPADATRQAPPCATGPVNPDANPAPVISNLRVSPARFRLGSPARIRFTLSETTRYRLAFDQARPGRRRGTRCRLQTRLVRTGRRCTHYTRRGTIRATGSAGAKRRVFRGRIRGRALPLGRYRLTATGVDRQGKAARAKRTFFTLRRRG
jgi:hypothetical protein